MSVSQKGHENKLAIPSRCSTGEKPRASGESFNVNMMSNPTDSAIIPGAHSPHFLSMKTKSGRKIQAAVGEQTYVPSKCSCSRAGKYRGSKSSQIMGNVPHALMFAMPIR